MNLVVIRHARAESRKEFARRGDDDDLRPLTDDGRERMRLGAAGLHRLVRELDLLVTSPLRRARETADLIAAEFDAPDVLEIEELRPETAPDAFDEWLRDAAAQETIAVVGHEMHLRQLTGWLMTGRADPVVAIKKGGALMLELRRRAKRHWGPGSGTLRWSLTPRQLRMLGRSIIEQPLADAQRAVE